MSYRSFRISNYRALKGPLTIDVERRPLLPIIGINESGKTTILHAIFSFDHHNDKLNGGRHLEDTQNLLSLSRTPATVEAEAELSVDDIRASFEDVLRLMPGDGGSAVRTMMRRRNLPTRVSIERDLSAKKYRILTPPYDQLSMSGVLAHHLVNRLPYILFFDDFRDKVESRILIDADQSSDPTGWLAIMEQLFRSTDSRLSVFDLPKMEERQRKSAIERAQKRLNETLTKEWQQFRLDDREALELSIGAEPEPSEAGTVQWYLKMDVVERDASGDKHYFYISDRSKGFYWFFNFVMKLEFNPKILSESDRQAVYLLDEPGSYLHASAQTRLCRKLKLLSNKNFVIYCTHSHYLLDPEVIPLTTVHVADRDDNGVVSLAALYEYNKGTTSHGAFQPVLDALHVKPFTLDATFRKVLIVEGIFDYYCLHLFRADASIGLLPAVGADSIKHFISLMIGWGYNFRALWDADTEGRKAHQAAKERFGKDIEHRLKLLPSKRGRNRIVQQLFAGEDLRMFRERLGLPLNSGFDRTIAMLFYSEQRQTILEEVSERTRSNFAELYADLGFSA